MKENESISFLNVIENKVDALLNQNKELTDEVEEIKAEKLRLSEEVLSKEEVIKSLENQIKILKIAKGIEGNSEEEVKALKTRVNAVIREVDKCISYLKN